MSCVCFDSAECNVCLRVIKCVWVLMKTVFSLISLFFVSLLVFFLQQLLLLLLLFLLLFNCLADVLSSKDELAVSCIFRADWLESGNLMDWWKIPEDLISSSSSSNVTLILVFRYGIYGFEPGARWFVNILAFDFFFFFFAWSGFSFSIRPLQLPDS